MSHLAISYYNTNESNIWDRETTRRRHKPTEHIDKKTQSILEKRKNVLHFNVIGKKNLKEMSICLKEKISDFTEIEEFLNGQIEDNREALNDYNNQHFIEEEIENITDEVSITKKNINILSRLEAKGKQKDPKIHALREQLASLEKEKKVLQEKLYSLKNTIASMIEQEFHCFIKKKPLKEQHLLEEKEMSQEEKLSLMGKSYEEIAEDYRLTLKQQESLNNYSYNALKKEMRRNVKLLKQVKGEIKKIPSLFSCWKKYNPSLFEAEMQKEQYQKIERKKAGDFLGESNRNLFALEEQFEKIKTSPEDREDFEDLKHTFRTHLDVYNEKPGKSGKIILSHRDIELLTKYCPELVIPQTL